MATHSQSILIRRFAPADEPAVIELWERSGLTRPWNSPERDITRKLADSPDGFLVATVEGRIVGSVMAGYDGHRGWINYLGVEPAHRRKGVARALMEGAERYLRERGCPKINLQIRLGNEEAVRFYAALGYVEDRVASYGRRLVADDRPPSGSAD